MSMNHCPSRQELALYLQGNLAELAGDAISGHLEICPLCEETFQTIEPVADAFDSLLQEPRGTNPYEGESEFQAGMAKLLEHSPLHSENGLTANGSRQSVLAGLRNIGDYRLLERIGEGAMGTVYKAVHTRMEKLVALKVLSLRCSGDRQSVNRFQREIKAVARLNHPNIVRATDAGEEAGYHYLVMEFVDGLDLAKVVKHLGGVPVPDACEIVRQAALGLEHAHQHGFVHRDVKPANLLLARRGIVKILDLGLALWRGELLAGEELTHTGQVMGTVDYLAPEQAEHSSRVDIRADVYSLGCTLFHLLAGHPPFGVPGLEVGWKKMRAHAEIPAPPVESRRPEVPEELSAMIAKMLAKDPNQRYGAPGEIAAALEPFATESDLDGLLLRAGYTPESEITNDNAPHETLSVVTKEPSPASAWGRILTRPVDQIRSWMTWFTAPLVGVAILLVAVFVVEKLERVPPRPVRISASASGRTEATPLQPVFDARTGWLTCQNGDFLITSTHTAEPLGDGVAEGTVWTFDFSSAANFQSFPVDGELKSARLVLTFKRVGKGIDTDRIAILGDRFERFTPAELAHVSRNATGLELEVELLDFASRGYTSESILRALVGQPHGKLKFAYDDDALISCAQLTLTGMAAGNKTGAASR